MTTRPSTPNEKLLAKMASYDALAGIEAAYRLRSTTLHSPHMKRLFFRFFDRTQRQLHYIEVVARMEPALGADVADRCEKVLQERLQQLEADIDRVTELAVAALRANASSEQDPSFLAGGLTIPVRVISNISRQLLRIIEKVDYYYGLLEGLRIDGAIPTRECDDRTGNLKLQLKRFAGGTLRMALRLRQRVDQTGGSRIGQHGGATARKRRAADEPPATPDTWDADDLDVDAAEGAAAGADEESASLAAPRASAPPATDVSANGKLPEQDAAAEAIEAAAESFRRADQRPVRSVRRAANGAAGRVGSTTLS